MKPAEIINDSLTMKDLLLKYHNLGKRRRTNCPIHGGKDNNFCYTDKVFHCWSCGASGNIVSFVMQLFNISFKEAVVRIDSDFNLNINFTRKLSIRERQELRKADRLRRDKIAQELQEKQSISDMHDYILFEWIRLDKNKRDYAPKNETEQWNPKYCEALYNLPYYEYLLDFVDWR